MRRCTAFVLALILALTLCACGGGEPDPNAGVYHGYTAEALGFTLPISDVYPGQTQVVLESGGKGTVLINGDDFKMKWKLEGDVITITVSGEDSVGTLRDGMIAIDFLDMGCKMTFLKEGATLPEATYNDAGYYALVRMDCEDPEGALTEEQVRLAREEGRNLYMELLPDGTGIFEMDGAENIIWQDGSITRDGMISRYTLEGDELTMAMADYVLVYRRTEK